jgi:hypothetical protein
MTKPPRTGGAADNTRLEHGALHHAPGRATRHGPQAPIACFRITLKDSQLELPVEGHHEARAIGTLAHMWLAPLQRLQRHDVALDLK